MKKEKKDIKKVIYLVKINGIDDSFITDPKEAEKYIEQMQLYDTIEFKKTKAYF